MRVSSTWQLFRLFISRNFFYGHEIDETRKFKHVVHVAGNILDDNFLAFGGTNEPQQDAKSRAGNVMKIFRVEQNVVAGVSFLRRLNFCLNRTCVLRVQVAFQVDGQDAVAAFKFQDKTHPLSRAT